MSAQSPVTYSLDPDGVGWLVFDAAPRANVLDAATWAALAGALDEAKQSRPLALVVRSAHERIFMAGADLKEVAALPDVATASEYSRVGQKILNRLAEFPVPVVCAIQGACAGGGYEVALACHWRIASDSPATKIGLPETGLGTIPGWGGTVRLPQIIGGRAALQHLVQAGLVGAAEALQSGLVDEVVPAVELLVRAKTVALTFAASGVPRRPGATDGIVASSAEFRATVRARFNGHQPAREAIIDLLEKSAGLPLPAALELETKVFAELTVSATCKNLIHVFFLREAARKQTLAGWFPVNNTKLTPIKRVGVVGAGVMGSGIAQWLAASGCDVVLRDVQPEMLARGLGVIDGLFAAAVRQGKLTPEAATAARARVKAADSWIDFSACDLVIEAIVEDVAAKQRLFSELAAVVREDAVLASNTSALPIEEIAGHVPHPERTIGLHFFNPVSRMPLVELIISRQTSAAAAERVLGFVKGVGKMPVICRSAPGFIVTRVLFSYLGEAVRLWEQGGSTAAIDGAMVAWGWPMGPLRLLDEVGLDVSEFIFGELAHYYPARFAGATACGRMVAAGLLGRKGKAGTGFYAYGDKRPVVNEAAAGFAQGGAPEPAPDHIQQRLLGAMVAAAEAVVQEGLVHSADELDFALLLGAGFPAFRGGLLRWARAGRTTA